jgi:hypothetical protein
MNKIVDDDDDAAMEVSGYEVFCEEARSSRLAKKKMRTKNPYKKSMYGNDTFCVHFVYVFINSITQFRMFFKDRFFFIFFQKKMKYVILKKRNNHTQKLYGISKRKNFTCFL